MAKRNIKDEILKLKERAEFETGFFQSMRINDLNFIINILKDNPNPEVQEFYKYLPIATVAAFESFTRASVKSLIDKGAPYFDNSALLFNKTVQKLDFDTLSNLQSKLFSIGELISHLLPCNSISDFESNFSTVLGFDFFGALQKHKIILYGEYEKEKTIQFRKSLESIKRSLARTFEKRHIFCHESNLEVAIDKEEILNDFKNCHLLLDVASDFILSTLYKDWGLTVHDQVEQLAIQLESKTDELQKKIHDIRNERLEGTSDKRTFRKHFDKTIKLWQQYSHEKALLKGSYSLSYLWSKYIYLEDRIKSIELFGDEIS